ncbi:class I SAM-dependent methyltransferase [Paenibacillus nanensis]|uniref:Class I SAM-dependent methyltransferase n=1 Tax=Paenibacillus nanensis TaxID=393251 RepID=A0A3A1VIY1_9BACL|nr:class I SAM-dependent methyltransferase [Paenibacillus nanensis]RIX60421.1 class I SAM-dependent methyltransferase [Paenibacillus nanensis]
MDQQVKKQFDAAAKQYDGQRRGLIPCFDGFYGAVVEWTEVQTSEPRILDLGAGTGLLSAMLLAKYPDARMTLIDFSSDMLEQAKARFAGNDRIAYITADYTSYPFDEPFDAIVSSLSIHHLPHPQKQALFKSIRGWLKPGGRFINADQAAGATELFDQTYRQLWLRDCAASGLNEDAIQASVKRRSFDINAKLIQQLEWLQDAGFSDVDCVFKSNEFAVFVAQA